MKRTGRGMAMASLVYKNKQWVNGIYLLWLQLITANLIISGQNCHKSAKIYQL